MRPFAVLLCFALIGCSQYNSTADDNALFNGDEETARLSPGVQPVRIGEGGPSFAACNATGRVVNISPTGETYLPVRAAPFVEADEVQRLGQGAQLFVCTRSIDQRWLGVVVPSGDPASADCGVSASVASAHAYGGPCKAGWVASGFVRLTAH